MNDRKPAARMPGQTLAEALGITPEPGAGRPLAGVAAGTYEPRPGRDQWANEALYQGFGDVDGYNDHANPEPHDSGVGLES